MYHQDPSKNFTERRPQVIVLHYTAGSKERSLKWLKEGNVSAHYVIDQTGEVIQLVQDENRAWHAGQGSWCGMSDLNSLSIGIELVHYGYDGDHISKDDKLKLDPDTFIQIPGSPHHWIPYADAQIQAAGQLVQHLKKKYGIQDRHIIGHSDLAPTRKVDPGPLFPWQHLYHGFGVGLWIDPTHDSAESPSSFSTMVIQTNLRLIGYDCPVTDTLCPQSTACLKAFKMHFLQDDLTDHITPYTLSALHQLAKTANIVDNF